MNENDDVRVLPIRNGTYLIMPVESIPLPRDPKALRFTAAEQAAEHEASTTGRMARVWRPDLPRGDQPLYVPAPR